MRIATFARAVAAAALLATGSNAGAAEPVDVVDQALCLDRVGCTSVFAGGPGAVDASASDTPCTDRAATVTTAVCVPEAGAGAEVEYNSGDPIVTSPTGYHPLTAGCSWSGSPGSRVDFGGRATAGRHAGGTITSVDIRCTLYVNGQYWAEARGVRWNDESWAHQRTFPPRGARLVVCLTSATARWSDGHTTGIAGANCPRRVDHT